MSKFNINQGPVIGQCIGNGQKIIQNFSSENASTVEIVATTSDHTAPSSLFSMTDVQMARKLLSLLDDEDCYIMDMTGQEHIEGAESVSEVKLARILRKLFNE